MYLPFSTTGRFQAFVLSNVFITFSMLSPISIFAGGIHINLRTNIRSYNSGRNMMLRMSFRRTMPSRLPLWSVTGNKFLSDWEILCTISRNDISGCTSMKSFSMTLSIFRSVSTALSLWCVSNSPRFARRIV